MIKAIVDGVRGATLRLQSAPIIGSVHIRGRHADLLGRDEEGQHPISAIDGLQEALDEAGELQEIPLKLPNPNALSFSGTVTGSYDGSEAVDIHIPSVGQNMALLWQNPDKTKEISQKEVVLNDDISNYDFYLVIAYFSTTTSGTVSAMAPVDMPARLTITAGTSSNNGTRGISVSGNRAAISTASYGGNSNASSYLIPARIYGIKMTHRG